MVLKCSRLSNLSVLYFCQNIFDNDFQGVMILKLNVNIYFAFLFTLLCVFSQCNCKMKSCIQIAQLLNNLVVLNKRLYDAWLMHRKLETLCCKRGSDNVFFFQKCPHEVEK